MSNKRSVEDCVNQALDDSVENLSPEVRRALNSSRVSATQRRLKKPLFYQMVGAMSLVVMVMLFWQLNDSNTPTAIEVYAEIPEEDLELLDELEFVYWLAEDSTSEVL
ncbi:hypothetical protein ACUR5C_04460 [Aliikangiella sp. IMCC44653]